MMKVCKVIACIFVCVVTLLGILKAADCLLGIAGKCSKRKYVHTDHDEITL